MKMFKVACLSYKAAEVMYRGHSISRDALISLRRDLIEKVTLNMIQTKLFATN